MYTYVNAINRHMCTYTYIHIHTDTYIPTSTLTHTHTHSLPDPHGISSHSKLFTERAIPPRLQSGKGESKIGR